MGNAAETIRGLNRGTADILFVSDPSGILGGTISQCRIFAKFRWSIVDGVVYNKLHKPVYAVGDSYRVGTYRLQKKYPIVPVYWTRNEMNSYIMAIGTHAGRKLKQPTVLMVHVNNIYEQDVREITLHEAQAMGFGTRLAYWWYWMEQAGHARGIVPDDLREQMYHDEQACYDWLCERGTRRQFKSFVFEFTPLYRLRLNHAKLLQSVSLERLHPDGQ